MLRQKIQSDQLAAMKAGEKERLETLRYIVAKMKYKEIEKKSELTDEEVIEIIRKQQKELQESIAAFEKGNRPDLVEPNKRQLEIITAYMPPEMSDEDLAKAIAELKEKNAELIAKNPKAIYGIAIKELKSKADPSRITKLLNA
jgi:uncharacterized protein YqeY